MSVPGDAEAAAIVAAVELLLASEAEAADALPPAYRSPWRRAALTPQPFPPSPGGPP